MLPMTNYSTLFYLINDFDKSEEEVTEWYSPEALEEDDVFQKLDSLHMTEYSPPDHVLKRVIDYARSGK